MKINKEFTAGFTIIEVMVSVLIFSLIAYGLIALVSNIFTLNRQQGGALADIDQTRKLSFQMVKELRNGQTGNNGAYVLDTAASQQIVFYSNIDSDPLIERIRYFLQNGSLWKGITEYNGTTYDTSTELTTLIQNDVANSSSTPLFLYYDGSYVGSSTQSSLAQPVNVTAVKFIKINLLILKKAGVTNTNYYTVTGGTTIRNLKNNLGS